MLSEIAWSLRDGLATRVARLVGRPPYQERLRSLIGELVPGRSFIDVGCMYNVHGAYTFHALEKGASDTCGFDVRTPTPECQAENAKYGNRARFVTGDINDVALVDSLGKFDVVFCSGVLYHVPSPVLTLENLKRMCGGSLILGSATIPELGVPQGAIYYPYLSDADRSTMNFRSHGTSRGDKVGLDTAFREDWDYSNYFWGMSPSCLLALLKTAKWQVVRSFRWRRAICVVCEPE